MDVRAEIVWKYKARAPGRVLKQLAETGRKNEKLEELARVTVWTRAGASIAGRVLQVEEDRRGDVLVLLTESRDRAEPFGTLFLNVEEIVSVEVAEPSRFAQVLSEGEIPRPAGQPVPSRLELKRRFADLGERLSREQQLQVAFELEGEIPAEDAVQWNLADLAEGLHKAVTRSVSDPLGKEAWQKIRRVATAHQTGAEPAAKREGDYLRLTLDLKRKLPSKPEDLGELLRGTLDAAL